MSVRGDYGARVPAAVGGRVARVDPGSPADRAGLRAEDTIVDVDGYLLADVLDWQWFTDGDEVSVRVRDAGGDVRDVDLVREPGEPWGVEFEEALFDGVRTCRNRCAFCFMTQLPRGLRPALYVRDDDYRLSFLQGNFVTLTNLEDADVDRIGEQHLSPLYVSLHSIDPVVRETLVCAKEDRALERFDELLDWGIDLHVQVVLVPGVNDGDELERTLRWLAEREGVQSVGIVPLGYTAHQGRFARSYESPAEAAAVIAQVGVWQTAMREAYDRTWVYLADEFYLTAGSPLPPAEDYDAFPQYENGIGMARAFIDESADRAEELRRAAEALETGGRSAVVVCGALVAPLIEGVLCAVDAARAVRVLPVENRFFGGNVGVTGLLTARDIAEVVAADAAGCSAASAGAEAFPTYLVPDTVLNADRVTLDDVPAEQIAADTGQDVRLVSSDAAGLLGGLRDALAVPSRDPQS